MEIIKRKFIKAITESKLHNKKLLEKNSFFWESHTEDFEEYQEEFNDYLSDDNDPTGRYIWATLYSIVNWHIELGLMQGLENDAHEINHLSTAALYGYWWLKLGPRITAQYRTPTDNEADISILEAARVISYLLFIGQKDAAEEVGKIFCNELHTLFLKGGIDWWLHPWFILQLISKWQHIELNLNGCDVPKNMNIYSEVLMHWDTEDIEQVKQLVNKMSDFHIETSKSDMSEDETNDFNESAFWFFPYEILAWLRIRELMGLPNPETYEHPLMQQPLAQMPEATPFPDDELLTQVVVKLKAEHGITD